MKKICFVGLDGSGKSTCADFAAIWLKRYGIKHKKVRAAYVLKYLTPLIGLVKKVKLQNRHAFDGNYREYLERMRQVAGKGMVYALYKRIVKVEFGLQIFWNIKLWSWLGYSLVIDRYIYDNAVTMAANANQGITDIQNTLETMWRHAPRPDCVIYVQTGVDVCMTRKSDIPDRMYLENRKPLYDSVARMYRFIIISGEQPKYAMLKQISAILENLFTNEINTVNR